MAADTKLGAKTVRLELFSVQMFPIDLLREQLAAQGLHVVTAADKAVLEAMAESRIDVDGWFIDSITEQAAGLAELARREALRG